MKLLFVLLIVFSAGCSTTRHLSTAIALNQGVNPKQRARYVARIQSALLKYVSHETPDFEHGYYIEKSSVQWIPIGTNGWLVIAQRSHHADHFYLKQCDWFGAVSVALDSEGHFYYSLRDICGAEQFRGKSYSTVIDFLKATQRRGWDWHPLPSPREATEMTDRLTEHELTEMADRYRKRLEDKGVEISALKVFPDRSAYIMATPDNGDLKPFSAIPVEFLSLLAHETTDLSSLLDLNLRALDLNNYQGSDLSLLARTKIQDLRLYGCRHIEFSTLLGVASLRNLVWSPLYENPSFERLRQAGNLERINGQPPAVFWREWDNGTYKIFDEQEADKDKEMDIEII
jgi:hypothetical protein